MCVRLSQQLTATSPSRHASPFPSPIVQIPLLVFYHPPTLHPPAHQPYARPNLAHSQVCSRKTQLSKMIAKHEIIAGDILIDAARHEYDMWAKITKEGFKSMISFRNAVEQRTALHILANGLDMTNPNEYNKWILDSLRGTLSRHDDELTRRTCVPSS